MANPKLNQTIMLANGRVIGFAEYGEVGGAPLLYFHGNPGSRLELTLFDGLDSVLNQLNLRIIAVDRPGIGLSDFQKGRRFLDWPVDVNEFIDKVLRQDRVHLLTYSAGGPFGLACALQIPNRLDKVTLVSSPCPFNEPGALEGVGPRAYWQSAKIHPLLTGLILRMAGGSTRLPPPDKAGMARVDYELVTQLEDFVPRFMAATFVEACRRGTRGPAYEAAMYVRDWGFSLTDIRKKVDLWHGGLDMNAPLHHMRWIEDRLAEKEIHLFPDEGHVTLLYKFLPHIVRSAAGLTEVPLNDGK
jgi:pimeloyl-ACP methyl ester carboxylesterase